MPAFGCACLTFVSTVLPAVRDSPFTVFAETVPPALIREPFVFCAGLKSLTLRSVTLTSPTADTAAPLAGTADRASVPAVRFPPAETVSPAEIASALMLALALILPSAITLAAVMLPTAIAPPAEILVALTTCPSALIFLPAERLSCSPLPGCVAPAPTVRVPPAHTSP